MPFFILRLPFFALFIVAEWLYRIGLGVTRLVHKIFVKPYRFSRPVIVVGNISSGGTGKSVFVSYLVDILGAERCGIVTRGYGGHGGSAPCRVMPEMTERCGDEACMLAAHHPTSVVVAARRKREGVLFLEETSVSCAIIDDGYQTLGIEKDCVFVLVDGRHPFENEHCLPAGPLREKDVSRANVVVVTHARGMTTEQKNTLLSRLAHRCVVWGEHQFVGFFRPATKKTEIRAPQNTRFCVVAGIGSIHGFLSMLAKNKVLCDQVHEFADHHPYTTQDVSIVRSEACNRSFVTTFKDWVKLKKLVPLSEWYRWYVVQIRFAFLSQADDLLVRRQVLQVAKP